MNDGTVPEYYCFTWHINLENIMEYSHLPVHLIIYTHFITSISKKRYNFFPWILWCREMYLMRGGGLFQFCLISYMSRGSSLGVCADALGWGMGVSPHLANQGLYTSDQSELMLHTQADSSDGWWSGYGLSGSVDSQPFIEIVR